MKKMLLQPLGVFALLQLLTLSVVSAAELIKQEAGFGVALNSALNGQVLPFRMIATGFYYNQKNQFELGVGMHPNIRQEQNILSADVNYKLFLNGRDNRLNLYLLGSFSYLNVSPESYFSTQYDYLFLHGGYGVELNGFAGSYIDTSVSFGGFTYRKDSENPASGYLDADQLFKELGSSIKLQVGIGYRF